MEMKLVVNDYLPFLSERTKQMCGFIAQISSFEIHQTRIFYILTM